MWFYNLRCSISTSRAQLSGRCLFTLVLAGAVCDLRIKLVVEIDRFNPQITELGLPLDTEDADGVDFNYEEEENFENSRANGD